MENKQLIETFKSDENHKGRCWKCEQYFKKGDWIIVFEKVKVYKVVRRKLCVMCYLKQIADKMGWEKINKISIL